MAARRYSSSVAALDMAWPTAPRKAARASSYAAGSGGRSASRAGRTGNGACGSVWYQYATDAYSFAKLLAWPCSTVQRSERVKRIGILDEPAIGADQPGVVGRLDQMEAVIGPGVLARRARPAAEDLLRAGAVDRRRPRLAVDEHHVVALAVPAAGDVVDLEQQTRPSAPRRRPRARRSCPRRRG